MGHTTPHQRRIHCTIRHLIQCGLVFQILAVGIPGFQINAMGFEQRHCHAACIPAGSTDCQGFAFEIRNGFDVAFNAGNILGSTGRDRKQRAHVFIFFDQIFRVFIEFTTALNGIFVMGGADGDDVGLARRDLPQALYGAIVDNSQFDIRSGFRH